MSDLILNVALKPLCIHEKGVGNKMKGETNLELKHGNTQAR